MNLLVAKNDPEAGALLEQWKTGEAKASSLRRLLRKLSCVNEFGVVTLDMLEEMRQHVSDQAGLQKEKCDEFLRNLDERLDAAAVDLCATLSEYGAREAFRTEQLRAHLTEHRTRLAELREVYVDAPQSLASLQAQVAEVEKNIEGSLAAVQNMTSVVRSLSSTALSAGLWPPLRAHLQRMLDDKGSDLPPLLTSDVRQTMKQVDFQARRQAGSPKPTSSSAAAAAAAAAAAVVAVAPSGDAAAAVHRAAGDGVEESKEEEGDGEMAIDVEDDADEAAAAIVGRSSDASKHDDGGNRSACLIC
eukprot:PLAT8331.1.p1 GENE.PLAT8331.1~~PLAT8331.1.p1  ORF type:complete len:303 (-),score=171.44 PLAT8331.1:67-975(-)